MYTSKTLVEKYLGTTLDAGLETFITLAIQAVQNYIENYCGDDTFGKRVFEAPTLGEGQTEADAIRYFDGNGQIKIFIGEAISVSALEVDGSSQVVNSDYFLKPYNAQDLGKPYEYIELVQPSGSQSSRAKALYEFSADQRNIKVTGKFRYSNVAPADIQLIATQMAGSIINEAIDDGIKAETLGDYRVDYGNVTKTAYTLGVNSILDQYKRKVPVVNAGTRMAS